MSFEPLDRVSAREELQMTVTWFRYEGYALRLVEHYLFQAKHGRLVFALHYRGHTRWLDHHAYSRELERFRREKADTVWVRLDIGPINGNPGFR